VNNSENPTKLSFVRIAYIKTSHSYPLEDIAEARLYVEKAKTLLSP
jgi:hypothetical protein